MNQYGAHAMQAICMESLHMKMKLIHTCSLLAVIGMCKVQS